MPPEVHGGMGQDVATIAGAGGTFLLELTGRCLAEALREGSGWRRVFNVHRFLALPRA